MLKLHMSQNQSSYRTASCLWSLEPTRRFDRLHVSCTYDDEGWLCVRDAPTQSGLSQQVLVLHVAGIPEDSEDAANLQEVQ